MRFVVVSLEDQIGKASYLFPLSPFRSSSPDLIFSVINYWETLLLAQSKYFPEFLISFLSLPHFLTPTARRSSPRISLHTESQLTLSAQQEKGSPLADKGARPRALQAAAPTVEPPGIVLLRPDWMMVPKSSEDSKVSPHKISCCSRV